MAIRIWAVIFTTSAALLMASPVSAVSCECWKQYENDNGEVTSTASLKGCAQGVYMHQCTPENNYPANHSCSGDWCIPPGGTAGSGFRIVCKAYNDDACTNAITGQTDAKSIFNPCWTKADCESEGGVWDERNQNTGECKPYGSQATARCFSVPPAINLQIAIPGLGSQVTGGFPQYMAAFYRFFVAALAVIAVVMVMWGGFKRIIAVGNPQKITDANETIIGAITGLVIALLSYTLLSLVNPRLVDNSGMMIDKVKPIWFGSRCPDPDPETGYHYQCGQKASVQGISCIGISCPAGQGCQKVGDEDPGDEFNQQGFSVNYQCQTPQQACEFITPSRSRDLHGVNDPATSEDYQAICNRFSQDFYTCTLGKDNCVWLNPADIQSYCSGVTTCDDIEDVEPENISYALCYANLCGTNCRPFVNPRSPLSGYSCISR